MTTTITANATADDKKGHFLVFHSTKPEQMLHPNPQLWKEEILQIAGLNQDKETTPRNYRLVALVLASSPEEVFELTNHLGTPWQQNPEVVSFTVKPQRSTSVGDVILRVGVLDVNKEDVLESVIKLQKAIMVAPIGFITMDY
jgi:hypothetical protein